MCDVSMEASSLRTSTMGISGVRPSMTLSFSLRTVCTLFSAIACRVTRLSSHEKRTDLFTHLLRREAGRQEAEGASRYEKAMATCSSQSAR